jgi:hypothetical protein
VDFQLNEEQLHLKKTVREFAEREIKPNVMKWDEAGEFPLATIKELGKLGTAGNNFPARIRRRGHGLCRVRHRHRGALAVDGSVGIIVAAHTSLCSNHIFLAGNEAQKKKYVSKLATGEFIGAWGLTEPSSGSDAGSARMTAVRKRQHLGAQRHQDFLHQRPLRRRGRCARRDRSRRPHSRPFRIRRRKRYQGISSRQERKQAGAARQRHRRTDLSKTAPSRGKSAGRRRPGISRRHARARRRTHLDRRACRWAWPRARTMRP